MVSHIIQIRGIVQGVGFRPFIYRIASQMNIRGYIENTSYGVSILINTDAPTRDRFIERIRSESPINSHITDIRTSISTDSYDLCGFEIRKSRSFDTDFTMLSPDLAVCRECLMDMQSQDNRQQYSFVNCTNCGPRFSITRSLPYDRANTTMQKFSLCAECAKEYHNPLDRRFHAQPVACNHCGPHFTGAGISDIGTLLNQIKCCIDNGGILCIKGLGGYNLMCDACQEESIERLRRIKCRPAKPFVIMVPDMAAAGKYATITQKEQTLLESPARPIVIVSSHNLLPANINDRMSTIGILLPYLPVHYQIFSHVNTDALLLTSGNISDEPIIACDETAQKVLADKSDLFISHNRDIHNPVDDSVCRIIEGESRMIRRSRGYVPVAFESQTDTEGILACGAQLNNTFALGRGRNIFVSQYIGSLESTAARGFFHQSYINFRELLNFTPTMIAVDMHPDYYSGIFGRALARELHIPLVEVQHHKAHAAACLAEHGIREPALAVVLDGSGFERDGRIHGSEFILSRGKEMLLADNLDFLPLAGGDIAIREPWRTAAGALWLYNIEPPAGFLTSIGQERIDSIMNMCQRGINTPLSCGTARIFDAAASLMGICHVSQYQGQAPMRLEELASRNNTRDYYNCEPKDSELCCLLQNIVNELNHKPDYEFISRKFHNTLARIIYRRISRILEQNADIRTVALSGGCFQNRILTEELCSLCRRSEIRIVIPHHYSCNDSAISLGQCVIAANLKNGKN